MSRPRSLEEFVERVRGVTHQAALDAAAVELLRAFDAAGVKSRLLKGPALARTLYRPGEHRGYSDIDLLVNPADLASARRALATLGYANTSADRGIDDLAGVVHSEVWFQTSEGRTLLLVDLHWRLAGCEAPADVAWEALAARPAWIELEGHRAPVLAREGLAVHTAIHAAQHGPDDLKALADLSRGIERWDPDVWRSAAELARQLGAIPTFAAGLRLVPAGAELAAELGLPPTHELEWAILNREARPRGTFHLQALADARGLRERVDVLRRSLLPTREWITWEYRWASDHGALLVAAYGAHLLQAPVWAIRAWLHRRRQQKAAAR